MTPSVQSDPIGFQLKEKISSLESALLQKHPTMPTLLHEIWRTLKQYPEQVTLLEDPDTAIIVSGLKVQTGVEFAAATKSSAAKSVVSKIKSLGADAF